MESSFQSCKECIGNPVVYCTACLRQYCYQHQDHKRQCNQIVNKVYGQTRTAYQQWQQKTTYFNNLLKNHLYNEAIQYLQVLKQHIQSHFTPESRFNAIQALQVSEFFLQSQIANNSQYCNKLYHQYEFLKQNNDALDTHQYIMFQEGRQHLQNSHRTTAQLNTINFCLYNQQMSTASIAFTSIKQQELYQNHQACMPFYQITLIRLINAFPSNQHYRNVFATIMKPVNAQINQYFKPINFIHFDQYEQTHFLLKIEILIQLLHDQMVGMPEVYRIYNLFEELKPKFNNNVKLKLISDYLLIKLGVVCCKITSIDALSSLQKKKLISVLDSTLEQIEELEDNNITSQLQNSQSYIQSKSVDSIYYLQHPLYHTFYIINKNDNILKQIKKYARILKSNSYNISIRQNVENVLNFSKVSSQYNMSQLAPRTSQYYDEQYQQQYYRSLINQDKLQNNTVMQQQKNNYISNYEKDDMTIGDLQLRKSCFNDNVQQLNRSQNNIQTQTQQSQFKDTKTQQANESTLAKSKLDILQQQSLVKINQQYITSRLQQHEQQQKDSYLLLKECETMNLHLSYVLASSKRSTIQ